MNRGIKVDTFFHSADNPADSYFYKEISFQDLIPEGQVSEDLGEVVEGKLTEEESLNTSLFAKSFKVLYNDFAP